MAAGTFNPKAREDDRHKGDAQKNQNDAQTKDQGRIPEITEKAKDVGAQVMDKAKEAFTSVGDMATQAYSTVGKKADEYTATAGADLKKIGDNIREKGPHDGMLGQASQAVGQSIKDSGRYLEEAKLSGMADDVSHLIQRHPVPSLLICLGIGFMLGRALRD